MSSEEQATEDKKEAEQEFNGNKFSDTASEAEEPDPFMDWLELETKRNPIDLDQIPAFSVRFTELIRKTKQKVWILNSLI